VHIDWHSRFAGSRTVLCPERILGQTTNVQKA